MAGVNLGFLKFTLGFDSVQFRKGMTEAERDLVKLQKSFEGVGKKLSGIGKTLSLGITAPLAAIGAKSFETAMDVQEMQSAFDVTFGKMAGSVRKWAEETGNAMGRSTQEIQSGALAFQELFGKALNPQKSAELSKTFAVLTQDLASFKNLSNEVAQQKLFSGLSGEAEPLRAVGVFLSDAKVKAEALKLGLGDVNGKLTEEEKILARAAVIQRELANASGDVLRTQSSTANQLKAASAAWQELQVVIGTKLLPVFTPLIEKLAQALNWFVQLPTPVQNFALGIAAVTAALGPVLIVLGSTIGAVAKMGPLVTGLVTAWGALKTALVAARIAAIATLPALTPFLVPLGAIALAVGAVYLAWKNWDKIVAIVQRVYTGVKTWLSDKLNAIFDGVKDKVKSVGDAFYTLWDRVVGHSYIPDMVAGIGVHMGQLGALMVQPAVAATDRVAGVFDDLHQQAEDKTAGIIDSFGQMATGVVGSLKDMVSAFKSGDILGGIQTILDMVLNISRALVQMGVIKVGGTGESGAIPGRAAGGPVVPGRTYLVGERGPEFITPRRSGYVHPNGTGPGATSIQINPSPFFEVVVDGRAQRVAAPMAAHAAVGGALGAQQSLARRRRMSLA